MNDDLLLPASFLQISIPSWSINADNEGKKYVIYHIELKTYNSNPIVTNKRYREFDALHADLNQRFQGIKLPKLPQKRLGGSLQPTFIEERKVLLEKYLQDLCEIPIIFSYSKFIDFLDDSRSILAVKIHVEKLAAQVQYYKLQAADMNKLLLDAMNNISLLNIRILNLEESFKQFQDCKILSNENGSSSQIGSNINCANDEVIKQTVDASWDISESALSLCNPVNYVSFEEVTPTRRKERIEIDTNDSAVSYDLSVPFSPGYFVQRILNSVESIPHSQQETSQIVTDDTVDENDNTWKNIALSLGVRDERSLASSKTSFDYLTTLWEPVNDLLDPLVEEVITMVQPVEMQINYRSSVSSFICKHARVAYPGVHIYEIGLNGLRCFLPDDPIRLSIFSSKWQDNWYTGLNDRLCRVSGGITDSENDDDHNSFGNSQNNFHHTLTNVSFLKDVDVGHKLQCLIDSSAVGVEIFSNMRTDLCLVAFFEELNTLIGQNNLFKRSLILIRAWWIYEANLSNLLSDTSISIMLGAIFNENPTTIKHPFQALYIFLVTFSSLDYYNNVITLFGIVSTEKYYQLISADLSGSSLVSEDLILKYQKLTRACDEVTISVESLQCFELRPLMIAHPFCTQKSNIVPDLTPSKSMIQRADTIKDSLGVGAQRFGTIIDSHLGQSNQVGSIHSAIDNFFQNTIFRFGRGWKPDMPNEDMTHMDSNDDRFYSGDSGHSFSHVSPAISNDTSSIFRSSSGNVERSLFGDVSATKDCMTLNLEKLIEKIKYCNLLLESQVCESALRLITIEVLYDKGPLPVGEVGKMLQDLSVSTSNTTISSILKERFGGLKKFLEKYPEDFTIGTDHPFNPHAYLRNTLSFEDMQAISRGELVVRYANNMSKMRKPNPIIKQGSVKVNRKKMPTPPLNQDYAHQMRGLKGQRRNYSMTALNNDEYFTNMHANGSINALRRHTASPGIVPDRRHSVSPSLLFPDKNYSTSTEKLLNNSSGNGYSYYY